MGHPNGNPLLKQHRGYLEKIHCLNTSLENGAFYAELASVLSISEGCKLNRMSHVRCAVSSSLR